jgi:hypothetical protein
MPRGLVRRLVEPPSAKRFLSHKCSSARAALAKMTHLEVDYSEPIDLIVVTPRG